ncbi:MAG: class I SAM-dependent methyltransferase [Candidatus Moranbacteria bacterium]|nr:class I SAM-dependent methyltransferase [Candidatus Moranbacteria bacterium]
MSKKPVLNKKGWTSISEEWGRVMSPDRPSRYEIEIYEDYIQKIVNKSKKKIQALILGATPELRDLLAKYDVDVTIVDINSDMINAMDQLLEYSDGKEKVVVSNWLEIPLRSDSFDVILCDHGVCHIPFEKWGAFFAEQARLLKKDGHLIKNVVTVEKNETLDVDDMIAAFKNNIFTRDDKNYYYWSCIIGMKDFEGKQHLKNFQDFDDQLEKFIKGGIITKKQFDFLKTFWHGFRATFPPKEVVDDIISRSFIIKSIRNSAANRALTCYKIYFGQVKK